MTSDLDVDLSALARTLRASTVAVHDAHGRGSGAGVVWDADGIVVTNAHVARGRYATIEFASGRRVRAALVGRDPERDLAALRFDPHDSPALVPARTRDSATLLPGELVVAVGNPHGIAGAMTAGLVHRCNAGWVVADVRLAPGNSGGPLADASGRVVGINSMIARGLAFAVPSAAASAFLRSLREGVRAA
ncbi:MAG: trypsin-like peptidase domain-containing protein [Candidatus Eremiobacteraeota bacterium]|nr:trypsin-like peptidase domain-containing protein [Candidatus Eremiobacteraeota bacterium]